VRKAIWLLLYFLAQGLRATQLRRIRLLDGWYVANVAAQVAFVVAVVHFLGWTALAYLFLSSAFAIGLHPVGARWIQEHFLTYPGTQETFSYYGPLNVVALNVGYHNEHHDLMRVPWVHLPELKRMAPELYQDLHWHRSWSALLWRFLTDPNITLYSRVIRPGVGPKEQRPEPVA
jgi:sphingolipid delta-4 desaturase